MTSQIKLTFLGTSAQIPTVRRNHSAILLNYNEENILIDCGEGTQRQIRKARLNPCKITRILITHWHLDHVLGLAGLLSTLASSGYNKTLYIYGPKGIKFKMKKLLEFFKFFKEYEIKIEEVGKGKFLETKDFYLEAEKMKHGIPTNAYKFVKKGKLRIDKKKLSKLKLVAGVHLLSLKNGKDIKHDGKKYKVKDITYQEEDKIVSVVLDTLNNSKINSFVKGSDLFVCEASYDSSLNEKAKEHLHMTARQAGEIAKKSKVKKLILTHISQRYDNKLKVLEKDVKSVFKDVVIAKDLDVVEV